MVILITSTFFDWNVRDFIVCVKGEVGGEVGDSAVFGETVERDGQSYSAICRRWAVLGDRSL